MLTADPVETVNAAKIVAVPENLDRQMFVEAMLRGQFAMHHNLLSRETCLAASFDTRVLRGAMPGLELESQNPGPQFDGEMLCLVVSEPRESATVIDNVYRLFGGSDARLLVSFIPMGPEEVMGAKLKTERLLSGKETGFTESTSTRGDSMSLTASRHRDAYYDAEEKDFLEGTLEALKSAALANGSAYKIAIFLGGDYGKVYNYLKSKLPILEEIRVSANGLQDFWKTAKRIDAMAFDSARAAKMVGFSNAVSISRAVGTSVLGSEGEVSLGSIMEGSVRETEAVAATDADAFNLGTLISGVPGTGKTFAAMHVAEQLARRDGMLTAIVSPTDEWNAFGHRNGFRVISLHRPGMLLNFFKCDSETSTHRFYENLAMLLASASDAGPYTGPLEKCLLSAFRRIYARELDPDPVAVYDAIEEAIVEQHGKRSAVGVKYTKHGENTRAALENLRSMLNRPEFSKREGVNFSELLKPGVVFDLSEVSNKMKQFYYALVLNQIYSVADQFDTRGDRDLRLLVCLEEAQTVFNPEKNSAATEDLTQRIQDFRKKGIGLMLITHSVIDIEPAVRRLCQTKFYFRQSADVAKLAANDLLFGETEKDALVERLKGLEQRVCAMNYFQNRERTCAVFAKLPEYKPEVSTGASGKILDDVAYTREMTIKIANKEGAAKEGVKLQLFYVGEKIHEAASDERGSVAVSGTIIGNAYRLVVLGEKKKDSRTFRVVGGELNIITI